LRLTIFAAGSRGDIQPCLALGKGLQEYGFEVTLTAPQNFAELASSHGLRFHPLRADAQKIMASEAGQNFMEEGNANLIKQIRMARRMLGPVAVQMAEDVFAACQDSEALISLAVFALFAKPTAEVRGMPLILVEPTPMHPTGDFPAPGWPVQRDMGRRLNRFSGYAMLQVLWQWYRPFVNGFRQKLDLPADGSGSFSRILASTPLLGAYSPRMVPKPADWPETAHITGYWFAESGKEWEPPADLQAFLEAGEPPVYVGFGSMAGRNPEKLVRLVLEALQLSGQRGVLLTGWGGMRALDAPKNVFILDSAPHDWLFPRMAAVVHHGGAGTTAEGLRAGIPAVILPFAVDQPFWGRRVAQAGVGPEPISLKKLTPENLASAIHAGVTGSEMRRRAAIIGKVIRAEDGVREAVGVIQEYLGA
jgi:sterol 3beta-glucosyltransferase